MRAPTFALLLAALAIAFCEAPTTSASPAQQVTVREQAVFVGGPPSVAEPKPMPTGSGTIAGQVVSHDSRTPIPGAIVSLTLTMATAQTQMTGPVESKRVLTDAQGRFAFRNLPAGSFTISAVKPGYADGAYGRTRPSGPTRPLQLAEKDGRTDLAIPLWKYASVSGTVVDEFGDPIVLTRVRVFRRTFVSGRPHLSFRMEAATDDRGIYRVGMLEPGSYVVATSGPDNGVFVGQMSFAPLGSTAAISSRMATMAIAGGSSDAPQTSAYPAVFFPSEGSPARADRIVLESGEDSGGVNVEVRPTRVFPVTGRVVSADGPAANTVVSLTRVDAGGTTLDSTAMNAFTDAAGAFTFSAVAPGQYMVRASTGGVGQQMVIAFRSADGNAMAAQGIASAGAVGPGERRPSPSVMWAETLAVVADRSPDAITLMLAPGLEVSGSLEFSGSSPRPAPGDLASFVVLLEPADPSEANLPRPQVQARSDGTFTIPGVRPGKYTVRARGNGNWKFARATIGGNDAADTTFDVVRENRGGLIVTFFDRDTGIEGDVAGYSAGERIAVLVFPTEPGGWAGYGYSSRRVTDSATNDQGRFSLSGLPSGSYYVTALQESRIDNWQDPAFLEQLAGRAATVRVVDGQMAKVSVQVLP